MEEKQGWALEPQRPGCPQAQHHFASQEPPCVPFRQSLLIAIMLLGGSLSLNLLYRWEN